MKQVLLFSVFALLMSCSEEQPRSTDADSSVQRDNKLIADSTKLTMANPRDTVAVTDTIEPTDNKFPASFFFYYTTSYCGGARPTDDIIQQHAMPRLLTSSTLKLMNHHTGVEYMCTVNPDGRATVEMEEGKYDIYLTKNINPDLATGFDPNCNTWLTKPLFTIKVMNDGSKRQVTLHFECNPCDETMKRRP